MTVACSKESASTITSATTIVPQGTRDGRAGVQTPETPLRRIVAVLPTGDWCRVSDAPSDRVSFISVTDAVLEDLAAGDLNALDLLHNSEPTLAYRDSSEHPTVRCMTAPIYHLDDVGADPLSSSTIADCIEGGTEQ